MSISLTQETIEESIPQEISAQIDGRSHVVQLESSLSHFRLEPNFRPLHPERPVSVVFEIKCSDGPLEAPAHATFVSDSENGALYRVFGLSEKHSQMLYNHFDNSIEGLIVSREQLISDKAPQLDTRDFQLSEKNRELAAQSQPSLQQRGKQWLLSGFFLAVIGFFGWMLAVSLYNIISEDWGQQDFYNHVAAARVRVAEGQLKELNANLNFTRSMLTKMEDPQFQKDISPIQEQLFQRDLAALEAHEEQMKEIVAFLKLNQTEVARGNFFYERRVLDTFSTQSRDVPTSSSSQLLMK